MINIDDMQENREAFYALMFYSSLSLKNLYNFVMVAVNASSAISKFLANLEFDQRFKIKYFGDDNKSSPCSSYMMHGAPFLRPYQISEFFYQKILSGDSPMLNFTNVRNPYTRFASALYSDLIGSTNWKNSGMHPFDYFKHHLLNGTGPYKYLIYNVHFQPTSLLNYYHYINYDFVIRFENIENDMQTLFPAFKNIKGADMLKPKNHMELLYNNYEAIEFVKKYYKQDFDLFGYSGDIKNIQDYDNSNLPRSLDKWHHPEKYSCDIKELYGKSIQPPYPDYLNNIGNVNTILSKMYLKKTINMNQNKQKRLQESEHAVKTLIAMNN